MWILFQVLACAAVVGAQAFNRALLEANYERKLINLVLDTDIKAINVRYEIKKYEKLKEWVLKKKYPQEGITFSQTIHKNVKLLKKELRQAITKNETWQKTATKIVKNNKIEADIPKYLKQLIKAGKNADLSPRDMKKYKTVLKRAMSNIENLAAKANFFE